MYKNCIMLYTVYACVGVRGCAGVCGGCAGVVGGGLVVMLLSILFHNVETL